MRILSITIHRPANCGSALQAFALNRYLIDTGYDAAIIDYVPSYLETEGAWIRSMARRILFWKPYKRRKKLFNDFIDRNCSLTNRKYKNYRELRKNPPAADVYMVGSDQLWNPCFNCGRDAAYYLDFVRNGIKMSYGTSLGTDRMPEQDLVEVAAHLKGFSYISVREQCSVAQLDQHSVHNVKWVCDPTLLLDRSVYNNLAQNYKELGKYTAVYLVEASALLNQTLEYLHDVRGLKTVGVSGYLKKYKADKQIMEAGPCEFLGLIRDSAFVLATSFHATIFSIIFQKDFAIILPRINQTRIRQLLNYLGLEDRIIQKPEDIERIMKPIDYSKVEGKLQKLREDSQQWLQHVLEEIRDGKKNYD